MKAFVSAFQLTRIASVSLKRTSSVNSFIVSSRHSSFFSETSTSENKPITNETSTSENKPITNETKTSTKEYDYKIGTFVSRQWKFKAALKKLDTIEDVKDLVAGLPKYIPDSKISSNIISSHLLIKKSMMCWLNSNVFG